MSSRTLRSTVGLRRATASPPDASAAAGPACRRTRRIRANFAVQLLEHEPAQRFSLGSWSGGERLELQAQVLGVVDDPLTPGDGLAVNNGSHLQELRHAQHILGRSVLNADDVEVAALDNELGVGVERGRGSLITSRNSKPRRNARVMAGQLEEGQ